MTTETEMREAFEKWYMDRTYTETSDLSGSYKIWKASALATEARYAELVQGAKLITENILDTSGEWLVYDNLPVYKRARALNGVGILFEALAKLEKGE